MMDEPPSPAAVAEELLTPRDFLRYAVSRFGRSDLVFGHGATTALDEAVFIVLEGLGLPIDQPEPFLDARLMRDERLRLAELIEARISTRKPAAYLLGRAYIGDISFAVDERVLVPRSFIGELLRGPLFSGAPGSLIEAPEAVRHALDLCTGSGCLAILAAAAFPNAEIDAVDLSGAALEVARVNVEASGEGDRIHLFEGDLFAPLADRRYDLIIANPPYVGRAVMAALPPEYAHEPALALDGGDDGFDVVRRILASASDHLTQEGALLCEIGEDRHLLESGHPELPFLWLDTEASAGEVFWLPARSFAPAARGRPRRTQRGPR